MKKLIIIFVIIPLLSIAQEVHGYMLARLIAF